MHHFGMDAPDRRCSGSQPVLSPGILRVVSDIWEKPGGCLKRHGTARKEFRAVFIEKKRWVMAAPKGAQRGIAYDLYGVPAEVLWLHRLLLNIFQSANESIHLML